MTKDFHDFKDGFVFGGFAVAPRARARAIHSLNIGAFFGSLLDLWSGSRPRRGVNEFQAVST
jgi:hypothetical protein